MIGGVEFRRRIAEGKARLVQFGNRRLPLFCHFPAIEDAACQMSRVLR
jgi:hypothetical protein